MGSKVWLRASVRSSVFWALFLAAPYAVGFSAGLPEAREPEAPGVPNTPTRTTPTPTPTPAPETPVGINIFSDVAYPVGASVDSYYKNIQALMTLRASSQNTTADYCQQDLRNNDRFVDRMAFFVSGMMADQRPQLQAVAPVYGAPSNVAAHLPVSLRRFPMCRVTASTLTHTLGASNVPAQAVINKVNAFVDAYNKHRSGALNNNRASQVALGKLWTRFMGCLSYTESLTTADSTTSQNVAAKYAPSGYRKPAGVKFYEDPAQPLESRLNIGLFQFTPDSGGNVNACLRSWNQLYPSCAISTSATQADMIRLLGSSYQTFNAFCGTHKLLQTFAIQVNTTRSSATHSDNILSSGLKAGANRCVTPFFRAGWAYNHFGPLQNSTGSNLNQLMTCVLQDLP